MTMKGLLILILALCAFGFSVMGIIVCLQDYPSDPQWFRNLGLILTLFGVGILLVNSLWPGGVRKE